MRRELSEQPLALLDDQGCQSGATIHIMDAETHFSREQHNPWFDWLRFFAAFVVLANHARSIMFAEYSQLNTSSKGLLTALWFSLTREGHEAVMLFFVLSGYLVGGPAMRRAMGGTFRIGDYALDRCVRILIPLFPAIVLTAFAQYWIGSPISPAFALGLFLSLQRVFLDVPITNVPLWTLAYEVWFYILGGAVALLLAARAVRPMAVAVILLATVVFLRLETYYVAIWFAGAAAYLLRPANGKATTVALAALLALVGVVMYQLSVANTLLPNATHDFRLGVLGGEALIAVGSAVMLSHLGAINVAPTRWARIGATLAGFSYSLYLVHMPLLYLQPQLRSTAVTAQTVGRYILAVITALAFAYVFSRVFEASGPLIKRKLRMFRNREVSAGHTS
jgi:peptidoglycan/LPS O-acetylase OafA/YrhL